MLVIQFQDLQQRKVVNKVSLQLKEAVGLRPNGAGKTTCFYMIAGLVDTDEGDISLNQERTIEYQCIYEHNEVLDTYHRIFDF